MGMSKWLVVPALLLIVTPRSFADDPAKLVGVWQLVSFETEFQATGAKEQPRGKKPTGLLIFSADGRMMAVLTDEGRQAPKTDQDRAALFNTMVAYAGTYRVDGEKWISKVDLAWNPAMLGSEQARVFKMNGNRLLEITPWGPRGQKGMGRGLLTWERAK